MSLFALHSERPLSHRGWRSAKIAVLRRVAACSIGLVLLSRCRCFCGLSGLRETSPCSGLRGAERPSIARMAEEESGWTFGPKTYESDDVGQDVDLTANGESAVPGLAGWLRHMGLLRHLPHANVWCVQNGASELEEVLDNLDDFSENLLELESSEKETLSKRARVAFSVINGFQ
eukprot:TRINITY_DN9800_c0_g1_i1.p1 TRINITY_DN9800_c0_g1~~TRINITY_DN9800_c0_g1_i1.p1  ORF type:complete len:196 (-),score=35.71 TRINITY_DN9800_c0_g1_i1:106-630(-)